MSLELRDSDVFLADFDLRYRWYFINASEAVAHQFVEAVWQTLEELAAQPGIGRARKFRHVELRGLRAARVRPPFGAHLIFYRHVGNELVAERLMHGAQDLPRRLRQPPGSTGK